MNKELKCLKRIDTKNYLTEREHKEFLGVVEQALHRLEAIDNANPSEALECLEKVYSRLPQWDLSRNIDQCNTIKQALLKAQETKHYLKWEDLEFGKTSHKLKCKMNDSLYRIEWFIDGMGFKTVNIYLYVTKDYLEFCTYLQDDKKQFFNDLHLERVEE